MVMIALTTFALAASQGTTMWLNAYELRGASVAIPRAGDYAVWTWVRTDRRSTVTVGKKRFEVEKKREKNDGELAWIQAGKTSLPEGSVDIVLGEDIAAAVLSTESTFDPKRVMSDMRVFSTPRAVEDRRARTAKHTDMVFVLPHYTTREGWESVAASLRRRVLLSSGLWPLPERTPLNAKIFGRITHDEYTVEKVYFEARPGFLVTGNLYRPVGQGPFPAVVCPHGHWEKGRLENGERGSVPGRCITLARMGMVAFSYDMIGYNDSCQFEHNWGGEREKLWGLHPFAMQLWSSIRAVDFVSGLPDVDPERIACTGASGGGTQTFALTAVEPRIKVSAPVNMISSTMQGGCLCENAPILRLNNSNLEIGALMAPRPLLMVSATGDWTRETPRVEYPAIRSIYALYDAQDRIQNVHIKADHNYNRDSREAMYRFFGKWLLGGNQWESFQEPPFEVEADPDLRVFPDKKLPDGFPKTAAEIIASVVASTKAKWDAILPQTVETLPEFRKAYGTVLADVMGVTVPEANDLALERISMEERTGYVVERWVIGRATAGDAVPAILYRGSAPTPQDAVLLVHGAGKAALADAEKGGPGPLVAGLISQGKAVLCIDVFLIGEHHAPDKITERVRVGRFMDTFQPTDTGYRVQDVVTALAFLRARRDLTGNIGLCGLREAGIWCLFAAAIDGKTGPVVVDLNRFPVDDDQAWIDTYYVPCIRSVGDVRTAAALIAPRPLVVMNTGTDAYRWLGARTIVELLDTAVVVDLLK